MKKPLFVLLLAALVLAAVPVAAGKQDFVLVNKTGYTIDELYVSSSKTNDWEEDVLGQDTLADGGQVTIRFESAERQCKFDIKVVDEDKDEFVWTDIDLCKAEKVTLKPKAVAVIE